VVRPFPLESTLLPVRLEPGITTARPLAASVGGMVTIDVDPPIRPRQDVRIIVGEHAIRWMTPLPGPGVAAEHPSFTIMLPPEVDVGKHPLRVEVDGATSELVDPPPGAPPDAVPSPYVEVT